MSRSRSPDHNIPATAAPTDPIALQGKMNFELKCIACHSIAGGDKVGPDLHEVTVRRKTEWIERWIRNPDAMRESDPVGKELLAKYKIPMPNQNATDAEIKGYVAYFKWADGQTPSAPRGTPDNTVPQHMAH